MREADVSGTGKLRVDAPLGDTRDEGITPDDVRRATDLDLDRWAGRLRAELDRREDRAWVTLPRNGKRKRHS